MRRAAAESRFFTMQPLRGAAIKFAATAGEIFAPGLKILPFSHSQIPVNWVEA